jgi:hypothetical protein
LTNCALSSSSSSLEFLFPAKHKAVILSYLRAHSHHFLQRLFLKRFQGLLFLSYFDSLSQSLLWMPNIISLE